VFFFFFFSVFMIIKFSYVIENTLTHHNHVLGPTDAMKAEQLRAMRYPCCTTLGVVAA